MPDASLADALQLAYPGRGDAILKQIGLPDTIHRVDAEWHKRMTVYVTYPDAFPVNGRAGFDTLAAQLPRIKALGCDAIHVLPFLASPRIDAGFDISDYYHVREDLGGDAAFERFLASAKEHGIRVFMDLVLNHVSDAHPWYIGAQQGDEKLRGYFVSSDKRPNVTDVRVESTGQWATYDFGGQQVQIGTIFPEQAGEVPHFVEGFDHRWYFHTFYPQQIDLDWRNPSVFAEFSRIISHWAGKGLNFRLDAVSFVGKDIWNNDLSDPDRAHAIVHALHLVMEHANPEGVFLLEAMDPAPVILRFMGDDRAAELAYAFDLMDAIWASLFTSRADFVWKALRGHKRRHPFSQWVTFLRNHDALSVELSDAKVRRMIEKSLAGRGLPFGEGRGIAGRTASFLDEDEERIILAHFLLASLPGAPAIIYGDEAGKTNDYDFMERQTREKRERGIECKDDTRDINRGVLSPDELSSDKARRLSGAIGRMLNVRSTLGFSDEPAQKLFSLHDVFSAQYPEANIRVLVNLSGEERRIPVGGTLVHQVGDARLEGDTVILPARSGCWLR